MIDVSERAVLVTGASRGIGAACALRLDRKGYRVYAGVRKPEDGEALAERSSNGLTPVTLDVCDKDQIEATAARLDADLKDRGIWGLVNNAGFAVAGPMEHLPIEKLRHQLEVNLVGQIAVTQAVLPLLRRSRGRVVNMGSIGGRLAVPYLGAYAASKHGFRALTDVLRYELRPFGISVSLIEPGAIRTDIWKTSRVAAEALADEFPDEVEKQYGAEFNRLRGFTSQLSALSASAEGVARAVERALGARRPKSRYLVGPDARALAVILPFVPDRLKDFIFRRLMAIARQA